MTESKPSLLRALNSARAWLSGQLTPPCSSDEKGVAAPSRKAYRTKLAIACTVIFMIATGVRFLHWQDGHLHSGQESLTHRYLKHAQQTLDGEGILFPRDYDDPVNVQLLVHPPGYSIFVAAIFGLFGSSEDALTAAQIVADSAAAVTVALIAAELLPFAAAIIAGLLVAFSPHLSHYSLFLLPDSLAALPILIAIYFLILSVKRPRLVTIIAAGFFIGLSCWLRANAQLLAVFVALVIPFLFCRGNRLRYSLAIVAATIITISPITIRNLVVFGHFIPLSLGAGIALIEGIGVYDEENRFGMPKSDSEAKVKDVEWHNRPDYIEGRWKPDGIERDNYRFRRGLEVIGSNPAWFAGVMIRRAGFMLRYNSPVSEGWLLDTARVPVVALEPGFGHELPIGDGTRPVWVGSPAEIMTSGKQLAPQAEVRLSADGRTFEVAGDASEFADQFASPPIAVEKNADYVMRLSARIVQGPMAAKVTSTDRRVALASALIGEPEKKIRRKARIDYESGAGTPADDPGEDGDKPGSESGPSMAVFEMPFATGGRNEVLLVISNNGPSAARRMVEVGGAQLYPMGPTPAIWTRAVRPPVRAIQRNLYTTTRMLPLIAIGIGLLALAGRKRALVVLLCVPAYYLLVQSAFFTEYRYILAIHYFLFILAGVTFFCAGKMIGQIARRIISAVKRSRVEAAL